MIEHVHLGRIEKKPGLDIAREGVVGEGIPEAGDHVIEFARAAIALGMFHVIFQSEIARRIRIGGGNDIPPRATAADMVERGKAAGDVIGFVERGRSGGDQADMFGGARQRRQQRKWFERGHGVAALQRRDRHIQHGQMVGHEERVEFAGFKLPDQPPEMVKIEISVRPCPGIAPCPCMDADGPHECTEPQLTFCHR